jgi:hypothetical protein
MLRKLPFLIVLTSLSGAAIAAEIECDREQTLCVTASSDLAIGDRVAVFNRENQVVALGRVKGMRGERRSVKIVKNYGTIYSEDQVALLNPSVQHVADVEDNYDIYKRPASMSAGANAGIASMLTGNYLSGTEVSGYLEKRQKQGYSLVIRGVAIGANGTIPGPNDNYDTVTHTLTYNGFGVAPGLAVTFFEQSLVSLRGELAGGFVYSSGKVSGKPNMIDSELIDTGFSNGFGPLIRGTVCVQADLEVMRAEFMVAQSSVDHVQTSVIGIGLSRSFN